MDIDQLIHAAVFSSEESEKKQARTKIRQLAQTQGIFPASINSLYRAIGRGEKEGFKGPVFIQGDHLQFSKNKFFAEQEAEIDRIKDLIKEAIEVHFYNIDI